MRLPGAPTISGKPWRPSRAGSWACPWTLRPIWWSPAAPPKYTFDPDELRRAFEQRPKALMLCNPSNPTGRVFTTEELALIAELAQEFDTWVITDEVYACLLYTSDAADDLTRVD